MGVLGWTYDQTLDTPMPAITAAIGARNKHVTSVLKVIAGFLGAEITESSSEPDPEPARKLSPALFDALFAGRK
jgi:hypothetical protein